MTPITIHPAPEFIKLLEMDPVPDIEDETLPDIAPVEERIEGLTKD